MRGSDPEITIAWRDVIWLYAMTIPSLILAPWALTPLRAALCAIVAGALLCLGHVVGLHRGVIHRAYRCSPITRWCLLLCATLTGVGGPLSMIHGHHQRDYWQNQPDPPRPFDHRHGMWANLLYELHVRHTAPFPLPPCWDETRQDPWLRFAERWWMPLQLALAGVIWAWLGWEWAVVGVCMRVAGGILGHWFVNYVVHIHGSQRWHIRGAREQGRNNLIMGWLSFGEGFHNNHHAYPGSARSGFAWWEIDLAWWLIRTMERVGLVWDVQAYGRRHDGRRQNYWDESDTDRVSALDAADTLLYDDAYHHTAILEPRPLATPS